MKYSVKKLVQFSNCDPFGIVFYPQYFYICSEAKEDFLIHIGFPQHHFINDLKLGWPMARLETDFIAPTRYGEMINVNISIEKIGRSSLTLTYVITGPEGDERMRAKTVIVLTDLNSKRPAPIPDDLRGALEIYVD